MIDGTEVGESRNVIARRWMFVDDEKIQSLNVGSPVTRETVIRADQLDEKLGVRENAMSCTKETLQRSCVSQEGISCIQRAETNSKLLNFG